MPYFGWARQDRKDKPRCSIGSKLVADILVTAGVDRVMTLDLHADQIQGFFAVPVDHVFASTLFLPFIKEMKIENLAIAAPDMGGAKRASAYAKALDCPVIICHKSREKANVIADMTAIGEVEGKNVIVMDDMIDTAGTITKAADMMMSKKALSVRAMATHALFSGPEYLRIYDSALEEVIITDTIPLSENHKICGDRIKILSVADLFADIIYKVFNYKSISSTFVM
jgi:ribose-phosphate pyrophosphokinase